MAKPQKNEMQAVLDFWFDELTPMQWFTKDDIVDTAIQKRFLKTFNKVKKGKCADWRETAEGRLAEIIVLDQFSRNLFRDSKKAFAQDAMALACAQEAVAGGFHKNLDPEHTAFMLMPYMHSENKEVHKEAVTLFSAPEMDHYLDFEMQHKNIIDEFGRYPHRNAALNRTSTPEEIAFLKKHSGF